jgi:hypothetical protein
LELIVFSASDRKPFGFFHGDSLTQKGELRYLKIHRKAYFWKETRFKGEGLKP